MIVCMCIRNVFFMNWWMLQMVDIYFQWPILSSHPQQVVNSLRILKITKKKKFLLFPEILHLGTSNAKYDICHLHCPTPSFPNSLVWRDSKEGKADGIGKKKIIPFAIERQEEDIYLHIYMFKLHTK